MNKSPIRLFSQSSVVFYVVLLLFCGVSWLFASPLIAFLELIVTVCVSVFYYFYNVIRKRKLSHYLEDINFSLEGVSSEKMRIPVPSVILNLNDNSIMWCNEAFLQLTDEQESMFEVQMTDIFPDFSTQWLLDGLTQCPEELSCDGSRFYVFGDMIRSSADDSTYDAAMLYFVDLTELLDTQDEYNLSRPVVSLIVVDNYDELTANQPDRSISNLSAQIDDAITAWTSESSGILRKLSSNRYLFIFESRDLPNYIDTHFSILDTARQITNDIGTPVTLSIGVGRDAQTLQQAYDYAVLSIEMSLSRGGDQAVVKDRYNFSFYGGKAKEAERRTKVKSRVMAGSLQELISHSGNILIMGHKNADLDAVGAAAGIMALCRKLDREAYIVIDMHYNAARSLLEKLQSVPEYAGRFLSPEDALLTISPDTLLVVVDTNRPDQVESRQILDTCSRVAVIDHHRRAADYIEDALLNFHEPYASSASELVTELVQYLMERKEILPVELFALLAGIVLDTKNFSVRTGSRTFEAAAWLRKNGADTVAVKLLFQNDLQATLNRYEILKHAELYRGDIALCCLNYTSDRITVAQAADELLNISGIQASFVFYPDGDRVICSARSIGEANVQMILEPLGGGGNQAIAGAQIPGMTPDEVMDALKASIDDFFSE